MKYLYALVIGLGLAISAPAIASADVGAHPGEVSDDATEGEFAEVTELGIVTYLRPIDDNAVQDMEPFSYDPTYPVAPDGNV